MATTPADKVKVMVVFAPGGVGEGKTTEVDPVTAKAMVREGRARYATDAQERKAETAK